MLVVSRAFLGEFSLAATRPVARQFLLDFLVHRSDQSDHTAVWGYALPKHIDELLVQLGVKKRLGPWALNGAEIAIENYGSSIARCVESSVALSQR